MFWFAVGTSERGKNISERRLDVGCVVEFFIKS